MIKRDVVLIFITVLLMSSGTVVRAQKRDSTTSMEKSMYDGINPEKASSDYYMRGKEVLITSKNVEMALKYFIRALECNPKNGAVNYELASFTSPDKALPYSIVAYQSDTTNYWYCEQLAEIYSVLRMNDKAINLGEQMVKLRPESDDSFRKLSAFYFYDGKVEKAMEVVDTIYARFGENPEIALFHCNMIKNLRDITPIMLKQVQDYAQLYADIPHFTIVLGDVYMRLGLTIEAVENYKKVKIIDPTELRGDVALFDYYNRRENQGEAVKYLSSVFKYSDIDLKAKITLYKNFIETNVYLYRNYFADVDEASMSLMQFYPKDMEVRKLYSEHLLRKGDIDGALAFNKVGYKDGIYDYSSFQMIMEIEAYKKNYDSMLTYLEKGYELFPDKTRDLNMIKVSLFSLTNRQDKAIEVLTGEIKAVEGDSLKSAYYGILGDIYHAMGKNKSAYKAYEKSLKYDSENIVVLNNYSYYLSLQDKELDKALKMALIVINKEPSNATYIDTYGWILYKLKRYNEAREVIAKAVALDTTKSSSLLLHYGDILYKLGQKSLAENYWKKALDLGEDKTMIEQRMNQK